MITERQYEKIKAHASSASMEDLHDRILLLYKEVKKLCEKHGLSFFAEGGTWVGAALCRGFVPWDDDMDLRMPRKDYENFLLLAESELPSWAQVINCTLDGSSSGNMIKVHDARTTFIESTKRLSPSQWTGVFIDITPFDYAPNDRRQREVLQKQGTKLFIYSLLRKRNHIKLDILHYEKTWWYSLYRENKILPPSSIVHVFLMYLYIKSHPVNFYSKRLDMLWREFDEKSELIVCPERPWEKAGRILYLPKKYYASSVEMTFCDTTIPVPVGYEEISILSYGFRPTLDVDDSLKYKHLEGAILDINRPYVWYQSKTKCV